MCGIIGIASNKWVSTNIVESLKRLEYRGYDSAGIATLSDGVIHEVKSEGRVDNLEKKLAIILLKKDGYIVYKRSVKSPRIYEWWSNLSFSILNISFTLYFSKMSEWYFVYFSSICGAWVSL